MQKAEVSEKSLTRQDLLRYYRGCIEIAQRYQLDETGMQQDSRELAEFRVTVPVIGSFNTGKSSLLNALMGCDLLMTSIVAETVAPIELWYGDNRLVVYRGGQSQTVGVRDMRSSSFDQSGITMMRLEYRSPLLEQLGQLCLVDMPGLDSGRESHDRAMRNYLPRSLAYLLVFNADEPVLKESVCTFLSELHLRDIPVYIILTKCDKTTTEEQQQAIRFLKRTLAEQLGLCNIPICCASAKPVPQVEAVTQYLQELSRQAEVLCCQEYGSRLLARLGSMEAAISIRIDSQEMSVAQLQSRSVALQRRIDAWEAALSGWEDGLCRMLREISEPFEKITSDRLKEASPVLESEIFSKRVAGNRLPALLHSMMIALVRSELEPKLQKQLRTLQVLLTFHSAQEGRAAPPDLLSHFEECGRGRASGELTGRRTLVTECLHNLEAMEGEQTNMFETLRSAFCSKQSEDAARLVQQRVIPAISGQMAMCAAQGMESYCGYVTEEIRGISSGQWGMMEAALRELLAKHDTEQDSKKQDVQRMQQDKQWLQGLMQLLKEAH